MFSLELVPVLQSAINATQKENRDSFEDLLTKLQFFFPDNLILSALDLIDRENVIKYTTPWGTTRFQVFGSTPGSSYSVFPNISCNAAAVSVYCSCPAFAYSTLKSDSQLMCKHLLAAQLAPQLGKCIERSLGPDDLASLIASQYSASMLSTSDNA
ncbi:hypothetical protein NEOLEDRAFT_1145474 [Neolentinus lepideus HHB14362 ss-1]|uniref:SWIM-type domain-containing protein n=1 Tax=Neolentinus lepideus HHB14362 ss-1 TaxID=1314782 RepID=A0A165V617_9AGAM|nr:hypothetical protein NEOLEDRAFT_1145474 [Neolentinus lepideus HHB14362 ss-1]